MALTPEQYEDYAQKMGLAGTAAGNLTEILDRLAAAQRAETAAAEAASAAGVTVAQLRAAQTAASRAAADAERALAAEQRAAAAAASEAAREAAAAAREAAREQAEAAREAAAAAKDAARVASESVRAAEQTQRKAAAADVDAFRERQRMATNEKAFAAQRAETSKWFADLTASGNRSAESIAVLREQAEALAPALGIVATIAATVTAGMAYLSESAVRLTQEKDAIRATFDVFTGGQGDALLDGIERISATLPFTADRLNAMAKSLLGAGIQGDALEGSLLAIASATAIMGDRGGAAAEGLIKRFAMMAETGQAVKLDRRILSALAEAGVTAAALAAELGVAPDKLGKMSIAADKLGAAMQNALIAKGGAALKVMGDSWGSIAAKLKEGWDDAFEDLGDIVGPFMSQLRGLASEFFAGSIAGGALKDVVRGLLTPAFQFATSAIRAMHIAVLYVEIYALKAYLALRPLGQWLERIGVVAGLATWGLFALKWIGIGLLVVLGALAIAVALASIPLIVVAAAVFAVVAAIGYLINVIGGAIEHFDQIKSVVSEWASSAAQAGADFVAGLVGGIKSGAGAVVQAVTSLASSALGAFTGAFQIKSPSRIMLMHGRENIAGATAQGIDEGTEDVDRAMTDLAAPPKAKGARGGGRGAGGGDRVFNLTINNCVFGGGMTKDQLWDWLNEWWEQQDAGGFEPESAS